ncbi:hypothetical protein UFOVP1305_10 [uncultured Caudovirales phage]|uniref:Uncharacterized protein n=1 Tax=uncultured Caudovirales phage TaxID=2100421 RepID=A0A6J5PEP3_9CAUD|nr:hypothetical protein UFOVP896_48 [uncultured Caudovirales phage]CAB4197378.1 hypothetical protein UFOVP1305_10 [uncultured Caudovirales phage]
MIRNTVTFPSGQQAERLSKTMRYTHCCAGVVRSRNGDLAFYATSWHTSERLARNAANRAQVISRFDFARVFPVVIIEKAAAA